MTKRSVYLFAVMVCLLIPSYSRAEDGTVESEDMRFAIALVQDLQTFQEPRNFERTETFTMPILRPFRIRETACVGPDGLTAPPRVTMQNGRRIDSCAVSNQGVWYKLERSPNRFGWVLGDHVAIWNSRHAQRPSIDASSDLISGYCETKDADAAAHGKSSPCMSISRSMVADQGERAPFPVIDTELFGDGVEFPRKRYFKVLVPTLYSNMVVTQPKIGSKRAGVPIGELEIILLIDATASMKAEIEGTKEAIREVIRDLNALSQVNARFMVIGYRDTDKQESLLPVESTVDSSGKPGFVSAAEAVKFLDVLESGEGGDPQEAIWDALYLLKNVEVTAGANRVLVLVGDTPSVNVTRGLTYLGTEVPSGMNSRTVFSAIADTIGDSTRFLALLIKTRAMKKTAEEMLQGNKFYDHQFDLLIQNDKKLVKATMYSFLVKQTQRAAVSIQNNDACRKRIVDVGEGTSSQIFCGTDTAPMRERIHDLVRQSGRKGDLIVIRELWLPETQSMDNVALVAVEEAKNMSKTMNSLAQKLGDDGSGCERYGAEIWVEAIRALIPVEETASSDGGAMLQMPMVGKSLHEFWRLNVNRGDSLINFNPQDIAKLAPDRCLVLRERLFRSSQSVDRLLDRKRGAQFLWLPFSVIP
jgi:hypothetical protein